MRPSYSIPGVGNLREITIWKAIIFGILTFGIYLYVVTYGSSSDIDRARESRFEFWVLFFIVGIFIPPFMLVVWVLNLIGLGEIRERAGLPASAMGVVALIFALLLPPVGQLIWAVHYNGTLFSASGA
jgi:hypothetical protein